MDIRGKLILGDQETNVNDILSGSNNTLGHDTIYGFTGQDNIDGLYGNDIIYGGTDNDLLSGGLGRDKIDGDEGNDVLKGGRGRDTLNGGSGSDILIGGVGRDQLYGDEGNDFLIGVQTNIFNREPFLIRTNGISKPGRLQKDNLTGGPGADIFVLGDQDNVYYNDGNRLLGGRLDYATITDFVPGQDIIQLKGSAGDYYLRTSGGNTEIVLDDGRNGPFISYPDELIGIVEGRTGLDLNNNFQYV